MEESIKTVIIDDDRFYAVMLSHQLRKLNFNVEYILHEVSELHALKSNEVEVDLFMLDYHMPDVDCSELIEWLQFNFPQSSVILISSNPNAIELMKESAMFYFLQKDRMHFFELSADWIKKQIKTKKRHFLNLKGAFVLANAVLVYLFFYFLMN